MRSWPPPCPACLLALLRDSRVLDVAAVPFGGGGGAMAVCARLPSGDVEAELSAAREHLLLKTLVNRIWRVCATV